MPSPTCCCRRDTDRLPRILTRLGVAALLALGVVRAGVYLIYALLEIPAPDQPFLLEGVCVHFAWCVQHGLPLYPEGQGPSYTVNYMGPCYFWIVGTIGRLLDADIPTLHVIGRVVTFLCGLGPAAIAALYLHRRYGCRAAAAGLVFGLGSAPMIGFGVMTRPDMMADLLGTAGFFIACGLHRRWLPAAALLLALGCLTKQTAGVWLLAAVVVLLCQEGSRRHALALGGAAAALASAIVMLLAATSEPNIVFSLLSQGGIPLDRQQQLGIVLLLLEHSPEVLFFALVGGGLWISQEHKDRSLLILTAIWMTAALFTCTKRGSNLNYFIPLRIVEAIAAGTLCIAAWRSESRRLGWAMLAWAGLLAMAPSTLFAVETARATVERLALLHSAAGRAERRQFEHYVRLAQDPNVRMLTDSDRLAVYQWPEAVLFDPYLFRLQVDAGQIDPRELVDRIESRRFEYVILSADVTGVYHDYFFYRLPEPVAAAVKTNYRLQSHESGLFVYVPRQP